MVDIGRCNHLVDSLELPLVPDGGNETPYHRFVFLWLTREAALHSTQALLQETPFHPQPDEPVALSQRLTERALSGRLFGAELITTVHALALLWHMRLYNPGRRVTCRKAQQNAAHRRGLESTTMLTWCDPLEARGTLEEGYGSVLLAVSIA
jgi:hypothetical protein